MMIINQVIGKMSNLADNHNESLLTIERVILSWDELHKNFLRKTTDVGRDIGIQLASGHLHPGDILFREGNHVIIVEVKEEAVLITPVKSMREMGLAAHAIGNMHAPIQIQDNQVSTPYNSVLQDQLFKLGLAPIKKERIFVP
jgi:urease accessory protein